MQCPHRLRLLRRHVDHRRLSSASPPTVPPASAIVRLPQRSLISISGTDAPRFLQGLTTNNVRPGDATGLYSAFLSASGRLLWDVFVYPVGWSGRYRQWLRKQAGIKREIQQQQEQQQQHQHQHQHQEQDVMPAPAYMVEVDSSQADALLAHLRRHKLRAKVDLRRVDASSWSVWAAWRREEKWTPHSTSFQRGGGSGADGSSLPPPPPSEAAIQLLDDRAPGLCRRLLLPNGESPQPPEVSEEDEGGDRGPPSAPGGPPSSPELQSLPETTPTAYRIRRILHGVPEGAMELSPGGAASGASSSTPLPLPLESNLDYMRGVDFRKGCYVGQELTIRTHHTGVVRKRILPVSIYHPGSTPPAALTYSNGGSGGDGGSDAEISAPPPGTEIRAVAVGESVGAGGRVRAAGRWIAGVGNVGLALCRLELLTDVKLTAESNLWRADREFEMRWSGGEGLPEKRVLVKAFVPDWHRGRERVARRV